MTRARAVFITGPAGAGKSRLGSALSAALDRPAIELGVIIRLLAVATESSSSHRRAGLAWRWLRQGRLDFGGVSRLGLAATVPRLDGRQFERELWTHAVPEALVELAGSEHMTELLAEITQFSTERGPSIIISREFHGGHVATEPVHLSLDADASLRSARKITQLRQLGLLPMMAAYDPPTLMPETSRNCSIDSTYLSPHEVFLRAWDGVHVRNRGDLARRAA